MTYRLTFVVVQFISCIADGLLEDLSAVKQQQGGYTMDKVKVLHLLQSNQFSGAENVVFQIISMFNEDDVEMAYCSRDGQIRDALSEADIDFYPLRKLSVSEVRRVIKTYKPDIVHAHDAAASVVASLSGFKQDIVSHMHVNHESMSKVNLRTVLLLLSSVRFKHIYWVSKSSYDTYLFKNIISRKKFNSI